MPKTRVLFLCTGNSARSQMAQAFTNRYAGDEFDAHSAGLEPAELNPYTVRVMEELDYDMSDHYAKDCMVYMGHMHFGYLVTVCAHAEKHCPVVFPGVGERLHVAFEDPAAFVGTEEETLAKFRKVRDQINEWVRAWLGELGHPVQGSV